MVGDLLVSAGESTTNVWNTTTGVLEHTLPGNAGTHSLALVGDTLAFGALRKIKLWSTSSWSCEQTLDQNGDVCALAVHGDKLLSSDEAEVKIWGKSAAGWACERTLSFDSDVFALQMCGDFLAIGLRDGSIVVKSAAGEWETVSMLIGHSDSIYTLALCDGKLVSGSGDHVIKVWA
jgi:WD40 repeat protein